MQILGVVPIFMSAGAAAMPTILAALASIAAVVFKPRELLSLCRRRPLTMGTSALAVGGCIVLLWWVLSAPPARATSTAHSYDWSKVALDILAQERLRQTAASAPASSSAPVPVLARQDFARTLYGGGPSPSQLQPLWSYQPEDAETMFLGTPALAGNRIFVAGCQADLAGYTGLLACLNADTGKPTWQITRMGDDPLKPFFSSPALTADGKYVVIGQGLHTDADCSLLCFETATGKLHWAAKTTLHIESSPAIFGDLAVVGAGAIEGPDGRATSDPGFVLAVRISDGKVMWRQPVNDPESSPAIDDNGIVYIGSGFNGNAVVALRSQSDEDLYRQGLDRVLWRTPVTHPVTGPISLAGDLVIAGGGNSDLVHANRNAQGQVVALDRATGRIRWQVRFADAVLGAIACRDGAAICPVRTGEVVAVSLSDGGVVWHTPISGKAPVLAGCAFTSQRIYAVSSDGVLAILDPRDGKVLERTLLNTKPGSGLTLSSPQVVGGRIIVGSETGGLRCLIGAEGTP